mmetsp:Transcript_10206/g.15313  ORF Transcript_10206/g.15313 Transcript_10206/m.15313 type:complete len:146 (+) Transcript_10206:2392-2829(+)
MPVSWDTEEATAATVATDVECGASELVTAMVAVMATATAGWKSMKTRSNLLTPTRSPKMVRRPIASSVMVTVAVAVVASSTIASFAANVVTGTTEDMLAVDTNLFVVPQNGMRRGGLYEMNAFYLIIPDFICLGRTRLLDNARVF